MATTTKDAHDIEPGRPPANGAGECLRITTPDFDLFRIILAMVVGLAVAMVAAFLADSWALAGAFGAATFILAHITWRRRVRAIFDRGRGLARVRTGFLDRLSTVPVTGIATVRLVPGWAWDRNGRYRVFDLDLLLTDGRCMNVRRHTDYLCAKPEAREVADYLGVPFADEAGDS